MSIEYIPRTPLYVQYFGSNRYYSNERFRYFTKNKIKSSEIVSFDCGLFNMYEIETHKSPLRSGTEQIIAVIVRPEIYPQDGLKRQGFTFCGYDLVEDFSNISAITNCGCDFESISYDSLNEFGLISTYKEAVLTQIALVEESDDDHACCNVCEIWRKLV